MFVFLVLLGFATLANAQRAEVETYLSSVYALSDFKPLSDSAIYAFFNNLTFYYDGFPRNVPGSSYRRESHPVKVLLCVLPFCYGLVV